MYWVGMDLDPAISAAEKQELSDFYSRVHAREVVAANPGFVGASRYELLDPDPRGGVHPARNGSPSTSSKTKRPRRRTPIAMMDQPRIDRRTPPGRTSRKYTSTVWRMLWHPARHVRERPAGPDSIFMVGMNVPADTDAAGLAEFNEFYTNTHVPEVMAYGGYARGTRFELHRAFAHPVPGSPRFCAIYEADAAATASATSAAPIAHHCLPVRRRGRSTTRSGGWSTSASELR